MDPLQYKACWRRQKTYLRSRYSREEKKGEFFNVRCHVLTSLFVLVRIGHRKFEGFLAKYSRHFFDRSLELTGPPIHFSIDTSYAKTKNGTTLFSAQREDSHREPLHALLLTTSKPYFCSPSSSGNTASSTPRAKTGGGKGGWKRRKRIIGTAEELTLKIQIPKLCASLIQYYKVCCKIMGAKNLVRFLL